jgi:hypothetical protein
MDFTGHRDSQIIHLGKSTESRSFACSRPGIAVLSAVDLQPATVTPQMKSVQLSAWMIKVSISFSINSHVRFGITGFELVGHPLALEIHAKPTSVVFFLEDITSLLLDRERLYSVYHHSLGLQELAMVRIDWPRPQYCLPKRPVSHGRILMH